MGHQEMVPALARSLININHAAICDIIKSIESSKIMLTLTQFQLRLPLQNGCHA